MDTDVYLAELCCFLLTIMRKDLLWLHFLPVAVYGVPVANPTTTEEPAMPFVLPDAADSSPVQKLNSASSSPTLEAFTKSFISTVLVTTLVPTKDNKLTFVGSKSVVNDENSTNPKGMRLFSSNDTEKDAFHKGSPKNNSVDALMGPHVTAPNRTSINAAVDTTLKPSHNTQAVTLSAKNADHVPMWRKDALREILHTDHTQQQHHTIRPPGPVFRPPSAISNKYGNKNFRLEPEYEDDEESNVRCWPECRNHTFAVPSRTKRKHNYQKKKFYNYKLLYDTLQAQKNTKKQKTEFYAWIFGATMLTLGSVTTLASCLVFCFCGDKLKKKKKKKKRRKKSVDDYCGEYQRVDSVSSMVSSRADVSLVSSRADVSSLVSSRADTEMDKEEQENSELLDSVTII